MTRSSGTPLQPAPHPARWRAQRPKAHHTHRSARRGRCARSPAGRCSDQRGRRIVRPVTPARLMGEGVAVDGRAGGSLALSDTRASGRWPRGAQRRLELHAGLHVDGARILGAPARSRAGERRLVSRPPVAARVLVSYRTWQRRGRARGRPRTSRAGGARSRAGAPAREPGAREREPRGAQRRSCAGAPDWCGRGEGPAGSFMRGPYARPGAPTSAPLPNLSVSR